MKHVCPNCGYCPSCGRGGYYPYVPYNPYPWYPNPWRIGPHWTGDTTTIAPWNTNATGTITNFPVQFTYTTATA